MGIGRQPRQGSGIGMVDAQWLLGLAGGDNQFTQSGIVALAGGAQATAPVIGAVSSQGYLSALHRVATVATATDSVQLVNAIKGRSMLVHNAGANAMALFASATVNKATGTQDVINALANGVAISIPAGKIALIFCAQDGFWSVSPLP